MLKTKTFKSIDTPVDEDFEGWQIEMQEKLDDSEQMRIIETHYTTIGHDAEGQIVHNLLVIYSTIDLDKLKEQKKKQSSPIDQPGVHPNQDKLIT